MPDRPADVGARRPTRAAPPLPPAPGPSARRFSRGRTVRLADVRPDGTARLDAVARWLQDVAADDVTDAGARDRYRWVIRRTYMELAGRPVLDTPVELATWCSGTGAAWAERRTTVRSGSADQPGATLEAAAVWVSLDPATLRPCGLGDDFMDVYGPPTGGRTVRSRHLLPAGPAPEAGLRTWPLRLADFDVLGHVNNAIAWAVLDEEAGRLAPGRPLARAAVEYREPIGSGATTLTVHSALDGAGVSVWLSIDGPGSPVAVTAHAAFA